MKLLFFGDSITDMNRNYNENLDNAFSYGTGYVFHIAGQLMYEHPGFYSIINKGISGNKITDLYNRFRNDVIKKNPDVITILIGVNDVWHEITTHSGTPIETFTNLYLEMIETVKQELPKTRIILMEPFVLYGAATKDAFERFKDIYQYAKVVEDIAKKTNCFFLPLQREFDRISQHGEVNQLLYDGVHTNAGGAYLIAKNWLELFKTINL